MSIKCFQFVKPQVENVNRQIVQHILENDTNVDKELSKATV